jgi:hypothetical protein
MTIKKETLFNEPINLAKLKHIVNNPKIYKERIDKEDIEFASPRYSIIFSLNSII